MTKEMLTPWKAAYQLAFITAEPKAITGSAIYQAAREKQIDATTAELMARLELFTLASVGALAQEGQQNSSVLALQIHNDLNNRTAYLAREIGRLWRSMPSPSLSTQLYNGVAGSVIGQRLGLTPIAQPQEPFDPVPRGFNRHKDPAFPPTLQDKLGTITGGGGTIVLADPEPKATDISFEVIVTFGAGSSAAANDVIARVNFGSSYDVIPVVNFSCANGGTFAPMPLVAWNVTKTGFEIRTTNAIGGNHVFRFSCTVSPSSGDSTF